MSCRHTIIFLSILIFAGFESAMGYQEKPAQETTPFQWLTASGETAGVKYPTRTLQPLSLQTEGGPPARIEQEEVQVNPQTTRITRRVFNTSANGGHQLTETVVEEIKKLPGDRIQAVRTISRKDANGRFTPVQREIQEMAPSGTDAFQIKKTLFLPGINNSLIEKEQIQQTERRKGDAAVEIDRTRYVSGLNGAWSAAERRVSQNTLGKGQTQTEEQVYQYDVSNRLSLIQQLRVTEWKNASGQSQRQSEIYAPNIDGKFQLDSRTTIAQKPMKDGHQETTEILERPSPSAPNEGLRSVRKIVENLQLVGASKTEKQLEVLEPDLNGGWQSIHSQQHVEIK
jgi:hypothetical protein